MQKQGLFILLLFCLGLFLNQKRQSARRVESPFAPSPVLLQPLTLQEKMLLGIPLPLNRLTKEELEMLPHISGRVAQRIVEYRSKNGPYKSMDALLNISGVGPKTLEFVRPFLETPSSRF